MSAQIQVLREVWRVLEYRGGAVYKTVFVETRWVGRDETPEDPDLQYVSVPTSFNGPTIRRVTL